MFPVPRTFFTSLADGHVVDEGEAEGDTRQGVDAVFDGVEQVVVVVVVAVGSWGVGKGELATTAFGYLCFPALIVQTTAFDRCDGFTREEGEWEWVGRTFLQWIVALFVRFLFLVGVLLRREGEACFSEEGECEDGEAGRREEDVQRRIVDPLNPYVWC